MVRETELEVSASDASPGRTANVPLSGLQVDEHPSPLAPAVRLFVIPYLLLSFLFYALVQLQHAVLGTVVVLHQHVRIVGLLATIAVTVVLTFRRSRLKLSEPRLVAFVAAYSAYLLTDFVFKLFQGGLKPAAVIYAETYLYFFVFFWLLMLLLSSNAMSGRKVLEEKAAFRILYVLATPIFAIGYAQFILNRPLLFVGDESGYAIQVYISQTLDHERAFSVFGSGFAYGNFITLMGALATAFLLKDSAVRRRRWFSLLLVGSTLAAFSTYTRNTYLEYAITMGGVMFVSRVIKKGWRSRSVVLASVAVSIAAYVGIVGFFLTARALARGILDVTTFGIRLVAVAAVVRKYFLAGGTLSSLFFGHGYIQGPKFAELQGMRPLMFDNTYVNIALFSGIVGLVMYVAFFVLLFAYVLKKYRQTRAYWWLALAGMYFSYPVVAALNIHVSVLYLITSLVMAYDILGQRRVRTFDGTRSAELGMEVPDSRVTPGAP